MALTTGALLPDALGTLDGAVWAKRAEFEKRLRFWMKAPLERRFGFYTTWAWGLE